MRLDVFIEVVTAGKSLAALGTHKPLLPRMSSQMTLQLVRPREGL